MRGRRAPPLPPVRPDRPFVRGVPVYAKFKRKDALAYDMKKSDIIDAVLTLLGPLLRLLAVVLEPRFPNAAQYCRSIGTVTDTVACVVTRT